MTAWDTKVEEVSVRFESQELRSKENVSPIGQNQQSIVQIV